MWSIRRQLVSFRNNQVNGESPHSGADNLKIIAGQLAGKFLLDLQGSLPENCRIAEGDSFYLAGCQICLSDYMVVRVCDV